MSIDKTIRIQDLPSSSFLESDNLIIINDSDNITRSITFDDFIANITELPGGINFPPTSPGVPGLSFCTADNDNCGTGIGSWKDCEIFISACGDTVVEVNQGGMNLNGDLVVSGDLEVNKDASLNGSVEIGNGCDTSTLEVNASAQFNCDTVLSENVQIGDPALACGSTTLTVDSESTFNCKTEFNDNVTIDGDLAVDGQVELTGGPFNFDGEVNFTGGPFEFDGNINVDGDLELSGNIIPGNGGNLDLTIDNIDINGDLVLDGNAQLGQGCNTVLNISSTTNILCDTTIGNKGTNTFLDIYSDTNIDGNLEVRGNIDVLSPGIFVGDGSGITNLNIPDNLTFKGDIDITKDYAGNGIDPTDIKNGDFYLNVVQGAADAQYTGIAGNTIKQNVFVYYSSASATPGWSEGADINDDGLVTLNGNQTITGEKFHTAKITVGTDSPKTENIFLGTNGNISATGTLQVSDAVTFASTLGVTGDTSLGGTLTVTGASTLNETLTVADGKATSLGGTLTVTGASSLNETLTVADDKATTLGGTLKVKGAATCDTATDGTVSAALVRVDYLKAQLDGDGASSTGGFVTLSTQQDGLTDGTSLTRKITAPKTFSSNVTIDTGIAKYVKAHGEYSADLSEIVNVGYLQNLDATQSDWVEKNNDISPRDLQDNISLGGTRDSSTNVHSGQTIVLKKDGSASFGTGTATISTAGLAKFAIIQLDHLDPLPN